MTIPLSKNPESLFPADILSSIQEDKPWRVAHTKSRREKTLAQYLAHAGIGYYLPMFSRKQADDKRDRYSLIPVFNGYLFFRADDFERHKAMRSNHIANILDVGDEKKLITELSQIQKALSGNTKVYPYDFIRKGQWVRVKNGPLKGVEGRIVRKDNNCRLVISVESIMQAIAVSIDADHVEPLHN
jgi:transcription antitermination factor NusG